jgi:hypothetical protein
MGCAANAAPMAKTAVAVTITLPRYMTPPYLTVRTHLRRLDTRVIHHASLRGLNARIVHHASLRRLDARIVHHASLRRLDPRIVHHASLGRLDPRIIHHPSLGRLNARVGVERKSGTGDCAAGKQSD